MNESTQDEQPPGDQPQETVPPSSEKSPPLSRTTKTIHLVAGFVGWFLVNGLLWLWFTRGSIYDYWGFCISVVLFLANLGVMIVLILDKKTRRYGQGILAAIGLNFLISLILGSFFNAMCFIPFFTPVQ